MAYKPLHHKYRPQTFAQLTGQEAISQTLTNALNSSKIAPAYLFSGPRGTGKTSSARILAKSLNCLSSDRPIETPCGQCEVCLSINNGSALDVVEIDAASNTGVDNIREIIESSQFSPVKCRYKVYVIDECHMLSTAAFNALLKTLEEPPPRVVFVLATTDPQRVLPTIISRCQRFDYRRIPLESMVKHLRYIAGEEQINIDDEALSLVAQLSNGGMRDAESLLDQLSLLSGEITTEKVWDLVGVVSEQDLLALLDAISTDSPETVITQCRKLLDRGREPLIVLQNLANFYLNLLIAKTSPQRQDLVAVTKVTWQKLCEIAPNWQLNVILQGQKKLKDSEVQIKNTTQPRLWLEITLLNLLPSANQVSVITETITASSVNLTPINQNTTTPKIQTETKQNLSSSPPPPSSSTNTTTSLNQSDSPSTNTNYSNLNQLKELMAQGCNIPYSGAFLTKNCQIINFNNKIAYIAVKNTGLLNMAKGFQAHFESVLSQIVQQSVKVIFQVDDSANHNNSTSQKPSISSHPTATPKTADNNKMANSSEKVNSFSTKPLKDKSNPKSPLPIESNSNSNSDISRMTKNAAENLAKNLNGEIIATESKAETINKTKKVTNRPNIEDISDNGEIPF